MDSKYTAAALIARQLIAKKYGTSLESVYVPPALVNKVLANAEKYGLDLGDMEDVLTGVFKTDSTKYISTVKEEKHMKPRPKWAGTISPHIQKQHDLGITPSYNSGGGCRHIINDETGQVQSVIPADAPPDEVSRFKHNARLLENKHKIVNRLRAKLAAKQTK